MNTYAKVQSLITAWKSQSLSRTDLIRAIAEACLGWPYVWGAAGQKCTPSHRLAYAARSACPEGEAARILKKCPVCSGKQEACSVCKYYPGGPVLDFDCRGLPAGCSLRPVFPCRAREPPPSGTRNPTGRKRDPSFDTIIIPCSFA